MPGRNKQSPLVSVSFPRARKSGVFGGGHEGSGCTVVEGVVPEEGEGFKEEAGGGRVNLQPSG